MRNSNHLTCSVRRGTVGLSAVTDVAVAGVGVAEMHTHECKRCEESIDHFGWTLKECSSPRLTYCMACYEEADADDQTEMEKYLRS